MAKREKGKSKPAKSLPKRDSITPYIVRARCTAGRLRAATNAAHRQAKQEHKRAEKAHKKIDSLQDTESYHAGADHYLVKPPAFESLVDIVERIHRGFLRPSKNLFLYPLVTSPSYRPPPRVGGIYGATRRREPNK